MKYNREKLEYGLLKKDFSTTAVKRICDIYEHIFEAEEKCIEMDGYCKLHNVIHQSGKNGGWPKRDPFPSGCLLEKLPTGAVNLPIVFDTDYIGSYQTRELVYKINEIIRYLKPYEILLKKLRDIEKIDEVLKEY